jgi:integrase-like protein
VQCPTKIRAWENGHIESFHDKLRDECLNRLSSSAICAKRVILESWRVECNERLPSGALGYRTRSSRHRERRTDLMGTARPQPGAARGGVRDLQWLAQRSLATAYHPLDAGYRSIPDYDGIVITLQASQSL